jgi:hypothetical protein
MSLLNEQQRRRAIEALNEYLRAPKQSDSSPPEELDAKRIALINQELRPLVDEFLHGKVGMPEFKSRVDSINKRNELWGFKGIKGQMFFNMIVNVAEDKRECEAEVKAGITQPTDNTVAESRIRNFASYVKRLGESWIRSGHSAHGAPKIGSIPFFLSYFWQIQQREVWPVYYTNTVKTMTDMNLWQPTGEPAVDYITFKQIHEELIDVFTKAANQPFDLYKVEHVFWFHGSNPYDETATVATEHSVLAVRQPEAALDQDRLPESYVPPVISVLPRMGRNDAKLAELAQRSGTALARAFEKSINAAFTVIGYETKLLGAGQGRVPDGEAVARDERYAIIWDAKMRTDGYSVGTDDRAMREYISTRSRDLKKRGALRNIYYAVISSGFFEDYDETIRSIKMETDVNEVCLVEAAALVAMVDAKLRAPLDVTLGPDGLQRLFADGGLLTATIVQEELS